MKLFRKNRWMTGLALAGFLLGGLLIAGCDSDPVAPQDELPTTVTEQDAAFQAGLVAMALAEVGPVTIGYASKAMEKEAYTYDFPAEGDISGRLYLDYRLGGATGTSSTWELGDYVHLSTAMGAPLLLATDFGAEAEMTFDIGAQLVQATDLATIEIGSWGTFTSGPYFAAFQFQAVVVTALGDYPLSGALVLNSGDFSMTLSFDGTNMATIAVDDVDSWTFNLDDGTLTPLT